MTRSAFGREKVLKTVKNESLGRKKFSLRVLLKPQFGEKKDMGRTMERKIAGERGESECKRGKIGGCGKQKFFEDFSKIF